MFKNIKTSMVLVEREITTRKLVEKNKYILTTVFKSYQNNVSYRFLKSTPNDIASFTIQ